MRTPIGDAVHVRILAGYLDRHAGSHVYNCELANRLSGRGFTVSVVCFERHAALDPACQTYVLRPSEWALPLLWRLRAPLRWLELEVRLRRLGVSAPDVVIGAEHLFLRAHARACPGVPFIYLPHSLTLKSEFKSYGMPPSMYRATYWTYRRIQEWAIRHSAAILRFSQYAREVFRTDFGDEYAAKIVVNPTGVEVPPEPARPDARGPFRAVWVGGLHAGKRIDVAIRALSLLPSHDWHFDIVGDGPCRSELETLATTLGVEDRCTFWGHQDRPGERYSRADLLLFPSANENFSITLLESMSRGVPVLAMRADGDRFLNAHGEVIQSGVNGWLAADDGAFQSHLAWAFHHRDEAARLGAEARRTISTTFTWDNHLDRYEALFASLLRT